VRRKKCLKNYPNPASTDFDIVTETEGIKFMAHCVNTAVM